MDTMTGTTAPSTNDQVWYGPAPAAPAPGLTVTDYARKIHWWVRLVGVVWLASIAFAVAVGLIIGIAAAVESADINGISGMSYSECMENPNTTYAQCEQLR